MKRPDGGDHDADERDVYNLMETASVLSKGLHRYETFKKDTTARGASGFGKSCGRRTKSSWRVSVSLA